jgi:ABC-2 type transport system ATP-binding protein
VFVLHEGKLLTSGTPADIRDQANNLCFIAIPPQDQPPRILQARLLDDAESIIDAVPQGGAVRFIRRADADKPRLDALLDGIEVFQAEARLEDGFMVLLSKWHDAQMETIARDTEAVVIHRPVTEISDDIAIEVKDLVRTFGQFIAVDHVSFSVRRGEIFGLLGPNGAGKTTTFRVLCGLLPASSGFVHVAGVDLRHARAVARRNIGYVSQKFALYGDLSVRENLEFFGSAYGLYGDRLYDRIRTVVEQFDLGGRENSPSGQLPGGFKQRLAMAVGLLHEPDILFLDEPTSGTDPLKRREFWRRITALSQVGTTIIITTHFMEEAEYCDRIVIQDAGKLLALGTPQEVRLLAGGKDGKLSMEQAFISIVERARQREDATHAEAAS